MVSLPVRGEQKEEDRFTSQHAMSHHFLNLHGSPPRAGCPSVIRNLTPAPRSQPPALSPLPSRETGPLW